MGLRNTATSWGLGAKLFHWVMAIGIIGTSVFVLHVNDSMPWFKSSAPVFIQYIHWHKAIGLVLLLLLILRLFWKWRNPKPQTAELAPLEKRLSLWTHRSLYALMFIVPLSGWIASSAFGSPTKFFGLFTIPGIIEKSKPLVGPAYWAHFGLSWLLLTIVSLHLFAAFWHHDRKKDNVLRAMWFGGKRQETDGGNPPPP
ncbi:MAG TPA: cytochrome b [Sphingopyxis sp.]|jgi:cytochrome b561|uniref:cytochrome b n=1 Tax=Sphingopyxis sp. TaxID=1908224 RepID=UPI002E11A5EC|nr:cytochrome b [Sphingopyxis sp.]